MRRAIRWAAVVSAGLLMTVPACASEPTGPELWRGAHEGMTPQQIKRLFPKAEPDTSFDASVFKGLGYDVPLRTQVQAQGRTATARFVFRDGALMRVSLHFPQANTRQSAQALSEALSKEIGSPGKCSEKALTEGGGIAFQCDWSRGELAITLGNVSSNGQLSTVIGYERASAEGSAR